VKAGGGEGLFFSKPEKGVVVGEEEGKTNKDWGKEREKVKGETVKAKVPRRLPNLRGRGKTNPQ